MKRFIKLNSDNYIIDIFHEGLTERMDGTEIEFDDTDSPADVWINGKCIYNEEQPVFKYINGQAVEV